MIGSLLIANRGEIACRIIRTARAMGVRTIAVYSDADAKALHVREADEAIHIGPSPARESYLVGSKIIAAAKAAEAEAIHPGYGFLSENADFAQAVLDAGLVWVGPKPASIRAMGLKDAAKERMIAAGVPVTPGYLGEDQAPRRLKAEADAIGYPVLIKAVAGGGGKGMRRVDDAAQFLEMLESCKREAASSFGDERVLIEKYILSPRHIEVQVFGDSHGNVVHLFERDCSLQRRHQKVIEEAPAPGMDAATREAVCAAAVRAAKAVDYEGAGTIEFIADASEGLRADRIWFMEMNTRLQVEHPVTEAITGQDLVEWQLRVASGEALPCRQDELSINGWAMEARLYAEDPATGFLPSTGTLREFDVSSHARVDTGVEEGSTISPFYDPMIAKIIVHAASREDAAAQAEDMCATTTVWPVKSNAGFLTRLFAHPDFVAGNVDTGFIERSLGDLVSAFVPDEAWASAAQWMIDYDANMPPRRGTPWHELSGFRANATGKRRVAVEHGGEVRVMDGLDRPIFDLLHARKFGDTVVVFHRGEGWTFNRTGQGRKAGGSAGNGAIVAPMPGKVTAVTVKEGDEVAEGQPLLTLEAMKMEHTLVAPFPGTVTGLAAEPGGQVSEGSVLATVVRAAD
ncbi:acetyl/propionyl/methylcrotonyl-CoA carboxylase subunit alpha [Parablastomonas sp. CN1-191]|uniref:acetyl/propionyl/methylcrotonyl-CoA carboxylase subunit alpha n=1 Tax=Parablastomonas sp. CN1-191 TaxID=3400908 RepID=UPI003BF861CD